MNVYDGPITNSRREQFLKEKLIHSQGDRIEQLEQQNKELVELVYKCRGMQYARSSAECSLIWEDVEKKLQEIKGE
jgi:hypothetical protein